MLISRPRLRDTLSFAIEPKELTIDLQFTIEPKNRTYKKREKEKTV